MAAPPSADGTTLRESLTVLAGLVILVLMTALVGPYFVDWSAQRPAIEARLSAVLGQSVTISGAVDIKLLPSPRLELHQVSVAGVAGQPGFSAEAVRLELAPMPLLRGELNFIEADFDQPRLLVTITREGDIRLPLAEGQLGPDTKFERISLHRASIFVEDVVSGRKLALDSLDLEADATSLNGPFKGNGQVILAGEAVPFRFSTGVIEEDKLRLRLALERAGALPQAEFDGFASLPAGPDGVRRPQFEGSASLSGSLGAGGLPWHVSGPIVVDRTHAKSHALEFRAGEEAAALSASGTGEWQFGARPSVELVLVARQLDLDRLGAGGTGAGGIMGEWRARLADPDLFARLPLAASVDFTTPVLTLGGQVLPDFALKLATSSNRAAELRLTANAPGRTSLALEGSVEPGAATGFKGQVQASTKEAARLAEWLDGLVPELADGLRALPFRRFNLEGLAQVSGVQFSGGDLVLQLDRSTLRGALALTRAVGAERGRLFADLTSQALDLDELPGFTQALAGSGSLDLAVTLDARAVKIARFGDGTVDSGRIRSKFSRVGASLTLDQLLVENLGGAGLMAKGKWDGTAGRIDASLDAARLVDLTDLLRRVAPGPVTEALAMRAVALSPARIIFAADVRGTPDGALALAGLNLDGSLNATKISAMLRPGAVDASLIAGNLVLDAPETAPLLRQLGLDAVILNGAGRGALKIDVAGQAASPLDVMLEASLAGTRLTASGKLEADIAGFAGTFRADSANAAPLARILGTSLPDGGASLPLALVGDARGAWGRWHVPRLSGGFAGSNFDGALELERTPVRPGSRTDRTRISGSLQIDRLSLAGLASLALGPLPAPVAGAVWPDAIFGAGLAQAPAVSLALGIASLDLGRGWTGQEAKLHLDIGPGIVELGKLSMKLAGGMVSGTVALRRDGANAAVSGKLGIDRMPVRQPSLEGLASGDIEFTSTGGSLAALAAGMAGNGRLNLAAARVPLADKATLARVLGLADKSQLTFEPDELKRTLLRELDKGPAELGDQGFDLAMAAGTLRLVPLTGDGALKLALDLRTLALDQRLVLTEATMPPEWTGVLPKIEVTFKGAAGAVVRDVEAGNFVNDITARQIARDSARIAALEADIRERASFNRRSRALKQMRQNEFDLQRYLEAEARRAADEEARRVAEARRLADEEARRLAAEALKAERDRKAAEEAARRAATSPPAPAGVPLNIVPLQPEAGAVPLRLPGAAPETVPGGFY